jgi:hypothetical protein
MRIRRVSIVATSAMTKPAPRTSTSDSGFHSDGSETAAVTRTTQTTTTTRIAIVRDAVNEPSGREAEDDVSVAITDT